TRGLAAFQCFEPFRRLARPMTGPPRASARPAKRSRHAVKRYIKENRKKFCGNTQCRARSRTHAAARAGWKTLPEWGSLLSRTQRPRHVGGNAERARMLARFP